MELKPYQRRGTPEAGEGQRLVSLGELKKLIEAGGGKAQAALNRINRIEGHPRLIQKILHQTPRKNSIIIANNDWQVKKFAEKVRLAS